MPKRKERVAPPPRAGGWDCRFQTSEAAKGWEQLRAMVPASTSDAWDRITQDPFTRSERQHPLKADLQSRTIDGQDLDQWQYEVTGAARIWYCIDVAARVIWLTKASVGHPKETE